MPRFCWALAVVIVWGGSSPALARHSPAELAAAQSFTVEGIGFRDEVSRARQTFTDKFPAAAGGQQEIDDRGNQSYQATLSDKRILRARYFDGVLYELELVAPRLQSSYQTLSRKFGQPDAAGSYGRSFQWRLGKIHVSLQVGRKQEVVVYRDTDARATPAGIRSGNR